MFAALFMLWLSLQPPPPKAGILPGESVPEIITLEPQKGVR